MVALFKPLGEYRQQLENVIQFGKHLLETGLRTKIDRPYGGPQSPFHFCYLLQARIARDYFLWVDLTVLEEWDALPVLKLRYAVQEATRSDCVSEWDVGKFETALRDFHLVLQTADSESRFRRTQAEQECELQGLTNHIPRLRSLYGACKIAVDSLSESKEQQLITKQDVWNWLRENPIADYRLPEFTTFVRYLRDIPSLFEQQKRSTRRTAGGRSVVRPQDV